ncbi:MAG TPA: ABC transporter permease subunit [Anaerolineae bacterium]|nr:ABC transporter permease subunit [Anaerolineae bacterium]
MEETRLFKTEQPDRPLFTWADLIILLTVGVLIYVGARLAVNAPAIIEGPDISLSPAALPVYALLSLGRMTAAYILALAFTLVYGRVAARSHWGGQIMIPLLDVLQSVPILSFLPVVLLSFSAFLSESLAAELASIILIFTSQVWNMTFAWYQSLKTVPVELREANSIFRFNGWMRFKILELPFGANNLIWNSMMSWAGGWFFLMAAEIFTVGQRDFRLPGLGSYLSEAAAQSDMQAIAWGVAALVIVIVALDQLVWRPLLAWADRFKLQMVDSEISPTSWFYDLLRSSRLVQRFTETLWRPGAERFDAWSLRRFPVSGRSRPADTRSRPWLGYILVALLATLLAFGVWRAAQMLWTLSLTEWRDVTVGLAATFLRVAIALLIALVWTIPMGVAIGSSPRLARWLQPIVQIAASVPATALFPVLVLFLIGLPNGLNLAAILLMLLGTQWYLLFNAIAGASAVPQDLKYTSSLLRFRSAQRWRTLTLPAIFPFIVTGAITASGGAWNASIVAEHVSFGGRTVYLIGIGALIARATADGNYPLLLASTLALIAAVVLINRLVWRPMFRQAEERYRME